MDKQPPAQVGLSVNTMSTKKHDVPEELLSGLLANYKKPEDLIGDNGLLKQLTKLLVERALDAELTEHLGHERNEAVANASPSDQVVAKLLSTDIPDFVSNGAALALESSASALQLLEPNALPRVTAATDVKNVCVSLVYTDEIGVQLEALSSSPRKH